MSVDQDPLVAPSEYSDLSEQLHSRGFDVCHPFHPSWYNDYLDECNELSSLVRLPLGPLAFLIGNTKHLWPHFISWWDAHRRLDPAKKSKQGNGGDQGLTAHPLDMYTEECVEEALKASCIHSKVPTHYTIFWGHHFQPEKLISLQRVALVSGFAYMDDHTKLTVHPVYGTWKSFRAVVVYHTQNAETFRETAPSAPPRIQNLLTTNEERRADLAMKHALQASQEVAAQGKGEETNGLCEQLHGAIVDARVAEAWIAVRDSIETGRVDFRFGTSQLLYHYTKDPQYLQL